ncbi:MAG: Wzz/FepE/Etk N-terminal domain-containing protein [Bryobacteraceae bacterium]|nr:Wzz/FepE/Etk N-terminal domain-containing protein [Bryobacteraceae bacterium]
MQPFDQYSSVQRRPLDVEDYIDILRRHRSWILGPAFLALVASVVVAFLWPDTYVSTALIRVVPPQVPEKLVPSNINQELSQRINAMAQVITRRDSLVNIIQTYGLYPRDQKRIAMEDIIEEMRKKAIRISPVQTTNAGNRGAVSAFQISFAYENRYVAQKVCADLTTKFIDENIRARSSASVMTTEFLTDQLEQAKRDLEAFEKKLTDFRLNNFGRLPDQFQSNIQQMATLERRMDTLNSGINRLNQEKLLIEGQMRILKEQQNSLLNASAPGGAAPVKSEQVQQADREILQMETALAAARERYKEAHPDIQRLQSQLGVLRRTREKLLEEEKARAAEGKPAEMSPGSARELREIQSALSRAETLMRAKDNEIAETQKELTQAQNVVKALQAKLEASPIGEQEYTELVRDRNLAKAKYEELNIKKSQSAIATDLENRKQGESLDILDQASLPETPTEPNRYMIVLGGFGAGIMIGLLLAGAREVKDASLKNLKDVRAYTKLTVLGNLPLLENDLVIRRRRRLSWLAWSTAFLLGVLVMSGSVYYYYASRI